MDPEQLKALTDVIEALRADINAAVSKVDAKCDALADSVATMKKKDEAGERDRGVDTSMRRREDDDYPAHPCAAERVAADSVPRSEFAALASSVADLKKKQARPMADLNAFADMQAKADAALRSHNERAEPPMSGEELVNYGIRMHRKMQRHSAKWKGVDLGLISADRQALENIFGEIRADTVTASMSTDGMPEFQHRMITKTMPGGHTVHEFIGNGTIFKQMSRPVRHVAYIGTRN
ncbi:hypothetical protein [Nitrobacter sp. JJSN]|uniref:hypothetical protein n=1 Tax=Nitrobacter sp. JJSN TaxID=3453033 RepID=UPI003F777761